jgi:Ras-related protein Rab-1A
MNNTRAAIKVVFAGDGAVGKTSLIHRFCEGKFESSRVATIGVDFYTKEVEHFGITEKLSIWDMAGQYRFTAIRSTFYRGCRCAALVYDLTQPSSLENLQFWHAEVQQAQPDGPFVVVGNKLDLARVTPVGAGKAFADSIGSPYIETSALNGEGVDAMFQLLVQQVFKK